MQSESLKLCSFDFNSIIQSIFLKGIRSEEGKKVSDLIWDRGISWEIYGFSNGV